MTGRARLEPVPHPAPLCSSYEDEEAVIRYERDVRVHRAHVEPFSIVQRDDGAFAVQGKSAREYLVDVVEGARSDTCTCPDFTGNRLGTCKHIEAVRRAGLPARGDDGIVTHASAIAARHRRAREDAARRSRQVDAALADGSLSVDVLTAPLFAYQREGAAHLVRAGRAVLADDMGLGKTVQAIAACEVLAERGESRRVLVVCPASLKAQWDGEIARYAGRRAVVVSGDARDRRRALSSDAPYVIVNYELIWREQGLLEAYAPDVVILDEAQRARNFRTKTASSLRRLSSRFLFVLTGTPVENRLDDLYAILQLVDPEVLGPLWKFNIDFSKQDARGKVTGHKNLAVLRRRIAPVILRRRKSDVLAQLPEVTEQIRHVPLTPEQRALESAHRRAAAALAAKAKERPLSPQEQRRFAAALLKARQAGNAARLCDPTSLDPSSPKLDELAALVVEVAAQATSKMIVFSEWTEMLGLAQKRLDEIGVGHLVLHGGVPAEDRPALLDAFRRDPAKVVLLSTDAGGVGLNLEFASYVVHLDLPWNPARIDQRVARAHRLGQTRGVSVTYLCAEIGIERDIAETLERKRAVRRAAMDGASDVDEIDLTRASLALFEPTNTQGKPAPAPEPAPAGAPADAPVDGDMDHARARLRLAQVVLAAGYPGDAVRASFEALSAARPLLEEADGRAEAGATLGRFAEHAAAAASASGATVDAARALVEEAAAALGRAERIELQPRAPSKTPRSPRSASSRAAPSSTDPSSG